MNLNEQCRCAQTSTHGCLYSVIDGIRGESLSKRAIIVMPCEKESTSCYRIVLCIVCIARHAATSARPIGVHEFARRRQQLVGVRAEVVALRLK